MHTRSHHSYCMSGHNKVSSLSVIELCQDIDLDKYKPVFVKGLTVLDVKFNLF